MNQIISLLRDSIQLYRTNATTIAGYLSWTLIPFVGYVLIEFIPNEEVVLVAGIILMMIEIVLWVWISIFLTQLFFTYHTKKKPDDQALQANTWTLIVPTLVVGFLELIVILGGIILFIIPGLVFAIWFTFAKLGVILEGKRGVDALAYSRELVRGRFFRSAGLVFVGPFLTFFLYAVMMSALVMYAAGGELSVAETYFAENAPLWFIVLDTLIQTFITIPLVLIYSVLAFSAVKKLSRKSDESDETKKV